jgi:hypothetical protein
METLAIEEVREIRATIEKLGDALRKRKAGADNELAAAAKGGFPTLDKKTLELITEHENATDVNYLVGLSVYGIGLMTDSIISDLKERVFELEEQLLMMLQHNLIQHEIIEHNMNTGKIDCPEKLSEQATFYLNRKGAAQ